MSRREVALSNLLDRPTPLATEDYPESIILPEPIHERLLRAIARTAIDGRERSLHFKYRRGHWVGGLALRGPRPKYNKNGSFNSARVNKVEELFSDFRSPHIDAHTHPSISSHQIVGSFSIEGLAAETIQARAKQVFDQLCRLPSGSDVRNALNKPTASVAQLVASETGSFLYVHKDLRAKKTFWRDPLANDLYKWKKFATGALEAIEEFDNGFYKLNVLNGLGVDAFNELAEAAIRSRSRLLNARYVSYASDNMDTPEFRRVPLLNIPIES